MYLFQIPVPPEPWSGVRDGTVNCNICAQFDRSTNAVVGDEDCLYLNVYTPKLPSEDTPLLPVMVYFHGGGFIFGNGTDDSIHGPDFLIEKNVIIASLNYRLGILGFLSLDRKEAPGNMGLRDSVLALKWIQQNIKSFGGDLNNVTIFGVSAGSATVEYLLLSPTAKGLFHKAIAQSGTTLNHWTLNKSIKDLAFKIASLKGKKIENENELFNYLLKLPIDDLITCSIKAISSSDHKGGLFCGFVPTIEQSGDWEPFLSQSAFTLLQKGEFTKVPLIMGHCSREGLLLLNSVPNIVQDLVKNKRMVPHLPFNIDKIDEIDLEKKLKEIYLEDNNNVEPDDFAVDFLGDVDFFGGIYVAAKLISKNSSPVYFYEFSYDGNLNYLKKKLGINRNGACHGDDGGYLIKNSILPKEVPQKDNLIREIMVSLWTDFAKYG